MGVEARLTFAQKAKALIEKYPHDISYLSMTVKKERVDLHIRTDPNKLYNYMICLSLIDEMSKHPAVSFLPDPRAVRVESGSSLHDYLQTQLWMDKKVPTILTTIPCESSRSSNIQFSDMLSGLVQSHFEDQNSAPWMELHENIRWKKLFF